MRLRRVRADDPGIARVRCGRGFRYVDAAGDPVSDPDTLARIKALVLPPAWEEVWIRADPAGHLQAVGTDAAGRRQYRYHDEWRTSRDAAKHRRILEFAATLPRLREVAAEHLQQRGLGREHVQCSRGTLHFSYSAKGSQAREQAVAAEAVCKVVNGLRRRRDGGPELLAWHATVLAAVGLAVSNGAAASPTARKRAVVRTVREVADYLGNTPAVARRSYIDPRVVEAYEHGVTVAPALRRLGENARPGELATIGGFERAVARMIASLS